MKIWIATGGTGGHVFPALALSDEVARRGHNVIISTDGRVLDMIRKNKPEKAGIAFVWASGVGAKSRIMQAAALFEIAASALALWLRFMLFRPARVVAFGGYASVPAVLAAYMWKIPTLLHEQNAAIGRANKFALRWVGTLMTSFPAVSGIQRQAPGQKVIYTGLPVRKEFKPSEYKIKKGEFRLLITGGSLGSKILDEVVPSAICRLPPAMQKKIFITHQTRPENVPLLQKFYADQKIKANVLSFIHDMAGAIMSSDLVIGRSGAGTVVELQTIGRPAILVPLGINPDQAANAESFAGTGAGFAIAQDKFTPKWLSATLTGLFDNPARLAKMAEKALVPNNAVDNIVKIILDDQ
ncbi:MAG: UDP-N-acetylglucosamine--N-acetylmuramyl-(pentapeptide) pyrophosphoryl-undecaprenol N-acetylglucosamine transferase [Rickettsiales bacterium]|jgi:UDP-N-acetylglucosamine--N-acetylmuramyl-(pentapeptide) pyrophosphoryl-undecaprenol N-acetylglucosamine transferase|nr:UDP-N-acetylglucosamine--N-acetylmuramyl-(pentapeptide) pyrophosphoryl-undecaprenol N-acetylglucosamine transferase [Rickettsiales bacterium]